MRAFVAFSFILACAMGAPSYPVAGIAHVAHAAVAPLAYGAVAPVAAVAHAAVADTVAHTHSVAPAPAHHPLQAGPVIPHPVNYAAPPAPAPFTTVHQGVGVTTVHQPAPIVTKQIHYGTTDFVSGYATRIIKPPTPHLPISVPTVLRGSISYNAPIIKEQVEVHNVQSPIYVERRVEVPYDVPVYQENIIQVPTPVHVDAPYNVPHPVPVAGEPIIKKTIAPPVVTYSHHHVDGGVLPAVHSGVVHHGAAIHGAGIHGAAIHGAAIHAAPAAALVH